jgi:hypothetical protein
VSMDLGLAASTNVLYVADDQQLGEVEPRLNECHDSINGHVVGTAQRARAADVAIDDQRSKLFQGSDITNILVPAIAASAMVAFGMHISHATKPGLLCTGLNSSGHQHEYCQPRSCDVPRQGSRPRRNAIKDVRAVQHVVHSQMDMLNGACHKQMCTLVQLQSMQHSFRRVRKLAIKRRHETFGREHDFLDFFHASSQDTLSVPWHSLLEQGLL